MHTSPSCSDTNVGSPTEVLLRKHSKSSLSQPTIPEEGPEHSEEAEPASAPPVMVAQPVLNVLKPKPESRAVKNLAQELGARTKEVVASSIKKSGSFKEESKKDVAKAESGSKSPKLSRQESMERTMQKITKAIRGTSRSESRSKKNREASPSPGGNAEKSKLTRKDSGKKSAQEKREMFKSLH